MNFFISLPLFKFSLPIPSLSLPCGPGDIPIVSDQNTALLGRQAHTRAPAIIK